MCCEQGGQSADCLSTHAVRGDTSLGSKARHNCHVEGSRPMLGVVLCGLGMFRVTGHAQVLGGGSTRCHCGGDRRAGAGAGSSSPAGRRRAAERRHRWSRRHGRSACRGRVRACPRCCCRCWGDRTGACARRSLPRSCVDPTRRRVQILHHHFGALPSGDIPPIWLELFFRWLDAACLLGICSLERGKRDDNLHIQSAE
jgi:hypothetical protein